MQSVLFCCAAALAIGLTRGDGLAKLTKYSDPGRYCGYDAGTDTIAVRPEFPLQCGSCLKLTCNNAFPLFGKTDYCARDANGNLASLIVTIDNRCPTCDTNGLDLNEAAFSKLASGTVGYINVWWEPIVCPRACSGPIEVMTGKWEQWYQEFRIRYATTPVAAMGLEDATGWWPIGRDPAWAAQFINNGRQLVGQVNIGLVDIFGSQVKLFNFVGAGTSYPPSFQFPRVDGNGVNRCAYMGRRLHGAGNSTVEAIAMQQEEEAVKFMQDSSSDYDKLLAELFEDSQRAP